MAGCVPKKKKKMSPSLSKCQRNKSRELFEGMPNKSFQLEKEASKNLKENFQIITTPAKIRQGANWKISLGILFM